MLTVMQGKAELFLIPFFSWCLLAFGGVPIDRKNRDQAVRAITKAAKSAKMGDCIAMSPEGTRSKTGQLLPFKKGPFYLWQQLQIPVIPMVTFGAYELYPPGRKIINCGKVYVKFLEPIQPQEAGSREAMSRLLRRRMLEAVLSGPKDAGMELTWPERLENLCYLVSYFTLCYCLWRYAPVRLVLDTYQISTWQFVLLVLGGSVALTLVFYVHMMFVVHWLDALSTALGWSSDGGSSLQHSDSVTNLKKRA